MPQQGRDRMGLLGFQSLLQRALFSRPSNASRGARGIRTGWFLVLFLLGLAHWLIFFSGSELDYHDWPKEVAAHRVWSQAVESGALPYHTAPPIQGARFLANPEISLTPQLLLLDRLTALEFIVVNHLLLYTLGALGFLLLANQLDLGGAAATILFLIFNFNGHLVAHISVGHSMWAGYYLLPVVLLLLWKAVARENVAGWQLLLAGLMFLILLQGFFHLVYWILLVMGLLALFNRRLRWPLVEGIGLALVLGAVRILPAITVFERGPSQFISGFPTLMHLLESMVSLKSSIQAADEIGYSLLGWWEIDHYVSGLGFLFMLIFGLIVPLREKRGEAYRVLTELAAPMLVVVVLTMGPLFGALARLPGPVFAVERVSTRFFLLPLLMLLVAACVQFQEWLEARQPGPLEQAGIMLGLLFVVMGLAEHSRAWAPRVARLAFGPQEMLGPIQITRLHDPTYEGILIAGAAGTALGVVYALVRAAKLRRRRTREARPF